jgi:molybdenum cofactor cytidylyltransferase
MQGPGVVAILLAAGEGRRMGMTKAILEYTPGVSFLDHLAGLFREAGCEAVAVVGKDAGWVRQLHPEIELVPNIRWEEGQYSSVKVGLARAVIGRAQEILVCPVDAPKLRLETIAAVRDGLGAADAAVPIYEGLPGHPLALSRSAAVRILQMTEVLHLEAALVHLAVSEVVVDDPGVTLNINTPGEYERLFGRPPAPVRRGG